MAASVVEQILARVKTALTNTTDAGTRVERNRVDAVAVDALATLNILRTSSNEEPLGDRGGRVTAAWDIECLVAVSDAWETAADALHMQVHAVLAADTTLATLGRGLRCSGTDAQGDSGERVIGKLTAHYQMQVFIRPGDLTRAIN